MACGYITLKVLELMLSLACIIYKRISDDEGRRLVIRQERQNYEWPLLRYITWEQNGSSYADITYGSYVIITTGLLIGYLSGELAKGRNIESFLLGFGALLFIAVGSLELAALDSVPDELIDNAAILGVVSLLTGGLFLLDLGLSGRRRKQENLKLKLKTPHPSKITQTDKKPSYGEVDLLSHKLNGLLTNGSKHPQQNNKQEQVADSSNDIPIKGQFQSSDITDHADYDVRKKRSEQQIAGNSQHSSNIIKSEHILNFPSRSDRISQGSNEDNSLTLPNVAFIMKEKGENGTRQSMRSKSPSLQSRMLPMSPVNLSESQEDERGQKLQLNGSVLREKRKDAQRYEKELDIPQEIVVMSPTEKQEYMVYKKLMKNLSESQEVASQIPYERKRYSDDSYDKTMNDTYATEEIIEQPNILSKVRDKKNGSVSKKGKTKSRSKPSSNKIKEYSVHRSSFPSSRDISDDIMHMSQSEREKYLFGESPKLKDSVSPSPSFEVSTRTKLPPQKQISSPESEHLRFDSRDANLIQNTQKTPRLSRESPSSPMDPGYVLHTAHNWSHSAPKTPSQSPTDVASGTSPKTLYHLSSDDSETSASIRIAMSSSGMKQSSSYFQSRMRHTPPPPPSQEVSAESIRSHLTPDRIRSSVTPEEDEEMMPVGGSLTTQLLQKWIKQRHTRISKIRSDP